MVSVLTAGRVGPVGPAVSVALRARVKSGAVETAAKAAKAETAEREPGVLEVAARAGAAPTLNGATWQIGTGGKGGLGGKNGGRATYAQDGIDGIQGNTLDTN